MTYWLKDVFQTSRNLTHQDHVNQNFTWLVGSKGSKVYPESNLKPKFNHSTDQLGHIKIVSKSDLWPSTKIND